MRLQQRGNAKDGTKAHCQPAPKFDGDFGAVYASEDLEKVTSTGTAIGSDMDGEKDQVCFTLIFSLVDITHVPIDSDSLAWTQYLAPQRDARHALGERSGEPQVCPNTYGSQ